MLPIGSVIPQDTPALRAALAQGLAPLGVGAAAISVDGDFPNIASLRLELTGARFTSGTRPAKAGAERQPGFFARAVEIRATPASVEGVPFHLTLSAEDVVFAFARTEAGEWALTIERAARGEAEFRIAGTDLEAALLRFARGAAEKQGAEIERVSLQFTSHGPRALSLTAGISAKAMFFSAKVGVSGRIEITDSLDAVVRDLACQGDGMLGNMAAGFLRPHFAKAEGRIYPLATLVPGLRDATLDATGGGLCVRASFGQAV